MKLFETKEELILINVDTKIARQFIPKSKKSKVDYGDYSEFLIEKAMNGNQDAIDKLIKIIKKAMVKSGCSNYEELYKRSKQC